MTDNDKQTKWPWARPWWCDCDSGLGYEDDHPPECMGEQPAFPRLMAAVDNYKET
jgi:hypothetical protein